jgi:predicted  nucleic acid-binding Zn-ribbon protein
VSSNPALIELARQDARLFQLRQQIASLPQRLQQLDHDLARTRRLVGEAEAIYDKAEKAQRRLEIDLQDAKQRRTKSEGRQASLTSTHEYQAVMKEIELATGKIQDLESSVLEAMERSEQARKRRDAEVQRLQAELARLTGLQQQLRGDLEAANEGVSAQLQKRDAAVAQVDPNTRRLYERVLKAKKDAAIALVSGTVCGICKGVQPPQVIQMLRQERGLQTCQICGRILVWDPQTS